MDKLTASYIQNLVESKIDLGPFTDLLNKKRVTEQDLHCICCITDVLLNQAHIILNRQIKVFGKTEVVWEWYDDIWYEYSTLISAEIERARAEGLHEFILEWKEGMPTIYLGSGYLINLIKNIQVNTTTKFTRNIRRTKKLIDFPRLAIVAALCAAHTSLAHIINTYTHETVFPVPSTEAVHGFSILGGKDKKKEKDKEIKTKDNEKEKGKDPCGPDGIQLDNPYMMTVVVRKMIEMRIKLEAEIKQFFLKIDPHKQGEWLGDSMINFFTVNKY